MVATLQVLVDAEDDPAACDILSSLLSDSEFITDWAYVKIGGQYLGPTEFLIDPDTYEEGDFLL